MSAILLLLLAATPGETCLATATTDSAIRTCVKLDLDLEDARLNTMYKAVVAKSDPEGKAILKKAQLAWIAYRDANCAWSEDKFRGGTLGLLENIGCQLSMTKTRADELAEWLALTGSP